MYPILHLRSVFELKNCEDEVIGTSNMTKRTRLEFCDKTRNKNRSYADVVRGNKEERENNNDNYQNELLYAHSL
jgi:hypothetical protein